MVGLIIVIAAALITLIASATTFALALVQVVQIASFVNHLAEIITNALSIQEDLDRGLKQRIDTLYDIVQIMRDKVQGMKFRRHCHA